MNGNFGETIDTAEKPKGRTMMEVFREVHRQSANNFFIQVMAKKRPDCTLHELTENKIQLVFELLKENEISDTLAANVLQLEIEDIKTKFDVWLGEQPNRIEGDC